MDMYHNRYYYELHYILYLLYMLARILSLQLFETILCSMSESNLNLNLVRHIIILFKNGS